MNNPMTVNLKVRIGWLKAMYLYSVVGAGGFGLTLLLNIVPTVSSDPFTAAALGCFELALALVALLGVRQPLIFGPLLAI